MENSNAGKAILGLGLGFGALGIAYYLYKNQSSSSSGTTEEEEATVTYGGFSGGDYTEISEDSGGATSDNSNNATSSIQDIISGVLTPILQSFQDSSTAISVTDLWDTLSYTDTKTTIANSNGDDYNSSEELIQAVNSQNPSDEQADVKQVITSNNDGVTNVDLSSIDLNDGTWEVIGVTKTNVTNSSPSTNEDYLNLYGLTESQYNSGLSNWMENYGGLSNKDTTPDYANTSYEGLYQEYLKDQKYYFENSKYYDASGDNWMISDNELEAQLSENAEKYRTESYDTFLQDTTMLRDKETTEKSISELRDLASAKNKYVYSGEAASNQEDTNNVVEKVAQIIENYRNSSDSSNNKSSNDTVTYTGGSGTTYTYDFSTNTKSDGTKLTDSDVNDIAAGATDKWVI